MTLAYTRAGSGPPLVLLHGVGHRRQAWDAVLGLLTPHRDVIVPDLPGHGESPPLDVGRRPVAEALAEQTLGLLDDLGLDRPHLAGNSLGGRLALEAAVAGRAASVTALSPAGFWRSDRELARAKGTFRALQAVGTGIKPLAPGLSRSVAGRTLMYATMVSRPGRISPEQAAGDMAAFLAARPALNAVLAAAVPYSGEIPAGVPVTVAWGARDRLLSPRQAQVARRRLPHATFVRLPGCGHVPMTDDPEQVAAVLLRGSSRPAHLDRCRVLHTRAAKSRHRSRPDGLPRLSWTGARTTPRGAACQVGQRRDQEGRWRRSRSTIRTGGTPGCPP